MEIKIEDIIKAYAEAQISGNISTGVLEFMKDAAIGKLFEAKIN